MLCNSGISSSSSSLDMNGFSGNEKNRKIKTYLAARIHPVGNYSSSHNKEGTSRICGFRGGR